MNGLSSREENGRARGRHTRSQHTVECECDALRVEIKIAADDIAGLPRQVTVAHGLLVVPQETAAAVVCQGELVVANAVALLRLVDALVGGPPNLDNASRKYSRLVVPEAAC